MNWLKPEIILDHSQDTKRVFQQPRLIARLDTNLGLEYLALNRLDEAKAMFEQAVANHLDDPYLHLNMYYLAFLQGDGAAMQQQVSWAMGKAWDGGFTPLGSLRHGGLPWTSGQGTRFVLFLQ